MYYEDDIADAEIGEFLRLNRKELEDIVSGLILIREGLTGAQIDDIIETACLKFDDQTEGYHHCDAHAEASQYVSQRLAHHTNC